MCEPHKELDLAETLAALGFVSGGELMEGVTVFTPKSDEEQSVNDAKQECDRFFQTLTKVEYALGRVQPNLCGKRQTEQLKLATRHLEQVLALLNDVNTFTRA